MVSSSSVKSSYMRTRATLSSIVKFCLNGPIIDSMTTGMTTSGKSVRSGWVSKTPSISLPHITSGNAPYRSINEYEAYSATGNYFPDEPACSAVMFHSRTTFWSAPME